MNYKNLIILIFIVIILSFFVAYNIYNDKIKFDEFYKVFVDDRDKFTEMALKSNHDSIDICRDGDNLYEINGINLDFKSNEFTSWGSPIAFHKITFDDVLRDIKLNSEEFDYYKKFIDEHYPLKCIKSELNMKRYPNFMVLFELNDFKGFAYISDGSITENIRQDIIDKKYKELKRIGETNWYEFTYKNKYGI